jgi:hypothetical protein
LFHNHASVFLATMIADPPADAVSFVEGAFRGMAFPNWCALPKERLGTPSTSLRLRRNTPTMT